MAEYVYNPIQIVEPNQNVLLEDSIPCNRGLVLHRNGSGILTLKGAVNNPCARYASYQVAFNAKIALPEDAATIGPIAVALAIDGEAVQTSRAIVTPAAADEYFNVTSTAIITIPRGCCFTVAVENTSAPAEVGGVAPEINVQNANLTVARIA